jgi:Fe-S oxidoreductase
MEKQLAFGALVVLAHVLFLRNVIRLGRIVALGQAAHRPETWGARLASLLAYFFGQRKVAEERSSWHHLPIYWGFLVIGFATTDLLLGGLFGGAFDLRVVFGDTIHRIASSGVDYAQAIVAVALLWALFRRIVLRPAFIPVNLDAMLILGGILTLCLTHFGHHVFGMAAGGALEPGSPLSARIGEALGVFTVGPGERLAAHVDPRTAHVAGEAHWWAHMLVILGFLNYLPFSKHIHVLGSGPNILLRKQDQKGVMPKLRLFDGEPDDPNAEPIWENWGVGRIEDFDWKSLLDNYACTECARCTTYCPAFATEKPLSPMHLVHDLKEEMKERGSRLLDLQRCGAPRPRAMPEETEPELPPGADRDKIAEIRRLLADAPPLVGGRIKDETLWACTTCGACQEVCPVFIDHPLKILQMRTHIVLNDEAGTRTPAEAGRVLRNIREGQGNPWNAPASQRMSWAEGLDVPTLEERPDAEYLFFVGCAGAYDDAAKKTTRALVEIMRAAGVDFAVLGESETCTGDTLRRLGDEMSFQQLAQAQVDAMNAAGVKKVVTQCPHCFHVVKNEYPQFGGRFEVVHHAQLVAHLLDRGKLAVAHPLSRRVAYHDSCYLGRWNEVYDAPRRAIQAATGPDRLVELERNRRHAFCCGAGGGRMWMEEEPAKRVNLERAREVARAGVEAVAVACPFCKTMLGDGMKHLNKEEEIEVLDLAQLVASTLDKPGAAGAPAPE